MMTPFFTPLKGDGAVPVPAPVPVPLAPLEPGGEQTAGSRAALEGDRDSSSASARPSAAAEKGPGTPPLSSAGLPSSAATPTRPCPPPLPSAAPPLLPPGGLPALAGLFAARTVSCLPAAAPRERDSGERGGEEKRVVAALDEEDDEDGCQRSCTD